MRAPHETDPAELLITHLDAARGAVASKLAGLDDDQLTTALLPSGWTPLQLLAHLVFMERRWVRWGFLAEEVEHPWGDHADDRPDGAWTTRESREMLLRRLSEGGALTARVIREHGLTAVAAAGGRFPDDAAAPTLAAIAFHVHQEYARHLGHLDVVRELIDGTVGEEA